jgi:hypothetical protein
MFVFDYRFRSKRDVKRFLERVLIGIFFMLIAIWIMVFAGFALAAPVVCTFDDNEQRVIAQVLDTFTGSTKIPAGGIENARIGVYLSNKLQSCVPSPAAPQTPPPAAQTPSESQQ